MYKALFDSVGNRITSFKEGIHYTVIPGDPETYDPPLPDGVIDISDDDQELYITGDYIKGPDNTPILKTINETPMEDLVILTLNQIAIDGANAYISGFYSEASGVKLFYDSDEKTQQLLTNIYSRTKEDDWSTKIRYPGVAPAGYAPIRGRLNNTSSDGSKEVQLLNAEQIKVLIDDLDLMMFSVKMQVWAKQKWVSDMANANNKQALIDYKW